MTDPITLIAFGADGKKIDIDKIGEKAFGILDGDKLSLHSFDDGAIDPDGPILCKTLNVEGHMIGMWKLDPTALIAPGGTERFNGAHEAINKAGFAGFELDDDVIDGLDGECLFVVKIDDCLCVVKNVAGLVQLSGNKIVVTGSDGKVMLMDGTGFIGNVFAGEIDESTFYTFDWLEDGATGKVIIDDGAKFATALPGGKHFRVMLEDGGSITFDRHGNIPDGASAGDLDLCLDGSQAWAMDTPPTIEVNPVGSDCEPPRGSVDSFGHDHSYPVEIDKPPGTTPRGAQIAGA